VKPALGSDEEASTSEPHECAQYHPKEGIEIERVAEQCSSDDAREGSESADMPCPVDESIATNGTHRIGREISRCDDPYEDRSDMCFREPNADQPADVTVGKLDQANAQNE